MKICKEHIYPLSRGVTYQLVNKTKCEVCRLLKEQNGEPEMSKDWMFNKKKVRMICPKCNSHQPNLISEGCSKCGYKVPVYFLWNKKSEVD